MPGVTLTIDKTQDRSGACFMSPHLAGFSVYVPTLDDPAHVVAMEVYCGTQSPSPINVDNAVLANTYTTDWQEVTPVISTGGGYVSVVPAIWKLGRTWVRLHAKTSQINDTVCTLIHGG